MTIKGLIERLEILKQQHGQDTEVWIASDAEGNGVEEIDEVTAEVEITEAPSPVIVIWPV